MALPTVVKTWSYSLNNRITFVSLTDTTQRYLFGIKDFLKTTGTYTIKGSASAGTGAMDGVDRWSTSASVTPQAANTTSSVAWVVLTDGNGCDICLSFVGGSADIARISFSPGGLYVAAGTANNTPTATDEQVILTGVTLVNATASADRLWNGWVSSDKKLCRFNVARSGSWTGQVWGVELLTSSVIGPPAVFSPVVWGFGLTPNSGAFTNQTNMGLARIVVASVVFSTPARMMMEVFSGFAAWANILVEAQGGTAYPIFPVSIASVTTGVTGKIGALIDWWLGRTSITDGDTYGTLQFINVNIATGIIWPWDGSTTPVLT